MIILMRRKKMINLAKIVIERKNIQEAMILVVICNKDWVPKNRLILN